MDRKFSKYTGCPICSWTCVGLTLIWVFHHVAPLPSHITIRPGRIGQRKFKSTLPSPRADGTPCTGRIRRSERKLFNCDVDIVIIKNLCGDRLRRIRPSQSGVYVCTARNAVGRTASRAEVYVQVPPMISRPPAASVVVEGGAEAKLDCEARWARVTLSRLFFRLLR